MRTWIVVATILVGSVGARANHFGWRRAQIAGEERGIVASHGMDLFEISTRAGGYSPARRAEIIAGRLEAISESHDISPRMFSVGFLNGMVIIQQQEHEDHLPHIVATIDAGQARRCLGAGGGVERLAQWRLALLRSHMSLAAGVRPVQTANTPVGDLFQKLFEQLDTSSSPVRSEDIDKAFSTLTLPERDVFRRAACTVPTSFDPSRSVNLQSLARRHTEPPTATEPEHADGVEDHKGAEPTAQKPEAGQYRVVEHDHAGPEPPKLDPAASHALESQSLLTTRIRASAGYSVELLTDPAALTVGKKTPVALRLVDTRAGGGPVRNAVVRVWFSRKGEPRKLPIRAVYDKGSRNFTFDLAPESPGEYILVAGVLAGANADFKVEFPLTIGDMTQSPGEPTAKPVDHSQAERQHPEK